MTFRCRLIRALRAFIRFVDGLAELTNHPESLFGLLIIAAMWGFAAAAWNEIFHWGSWSLVAPVIPAGIIVALVYLCKLIARGWRALRGWADRKVEECKAS